MTVKIAICDNDDQFAQTVKQNMEHYLKERDEEQGTSMEYKIVLYNSAKILADDIAEGIIYDILLLDVEMSEMNGVEAARRIKKIRPQILLFFISDYEKYVWDAFECDPFRYLPKNQMEERFKGWFLEALRQLKKKQERFLYYTRNSEKGMIPIGDILYIWHERKDAVVETYTGEIRIRKNLKDIYKELPEGEFLWANRGAICSLAQIKRKTERSLVMKNDKEIEIAMDRLKRVGQEIAEYWQREMGKSWK